MKEKVKLSLRDDKKETKPVVPELELYLEQDEKDVMLCGKDGEGLSWNLLIFRCNGKFERVVNVGDDLGLQVNKNGQILEAK